MAAFVREIRRRIRGIQNIGQITAAMELVAVSRLRRIEGKARAARPYVENISSLMQELAATGVKVPLMTPREVKRVAVMVITSDRGLCGAYNSNIMKATSAFLDETPFPSLLLCIGKKGYDFFRRRGYAIHAFSPQFSREIPPGEVRRMTGEIIAGYERGEYDEVHLFYTRYITALQMIPTRVQVIPVVAETKPGGGYLEYIFEPSVGEILAEQIPAYIEAHLFRALLESMASEQGARMVAMKSATDNAQELIATLTLSYNKARQAGITRELIEITSAKEALQEIRGGK